MNLTGNVNVDEVQHPMKATYEKKNCTSLSELKAKGHNQAVLK